MAVKVAAMPSARPDLLRKLAAALQNDPTLVHGLRATPFQTLNSVKSISAQDVHELVRSDVPSIVAQLAPPLSKTRTTDASLIGKLADAVRADPTLVHGLRAAPVQTLSNIKSLSAQDVHELARGDIVSIVAQIAPLGVSPSLSAAAGRISDKLRASRRRNVPRELLPKLAKEIQADPTLLLALSAAPHQTLSSLGSFSPQEVQHLVRADIASVAARLRRTATSLATQPTKVLIR